MLNVCMVGHGMMGRWHSEALKARQDCRLYHLVGRRPEPTEAFAREFGYASWSIDLGESLKDPAIDVVVVATPSEEHAAGATASLEAGRHTLLEIPIGMSLAEAERVVRAAQTRQLKLGLVYPMRMMPDMLELRGRVARGEERVRLVEARFIIKRWENVGWTGYRRSWTDNLLWHHLGHLVDFGLWITGAAATSVSGFRPSPDPRTGTPMDAFVGVGTDEDQSLVVVGSYAGHEPISDTLVLTDRDCYRIDAIAGTLTTQAGRKLLASEQVDCAAALNDFLDAVRQDREPAIPGGSVLPMMRVLQTVQDAWDARTHIRSVPGRQAAGR
jgi:2-hydroxy-4-carboxymuconate semialdehyde hemiacetal dehydrogenase